jgi:hypothetical protein
MPGEQAAIIEPSVCKSIHDDCGRVSAAEPKPSPHICTFYDVGPNYLVMELVEGETRLPRSIRHNGRGTLQRRDRLYMWIIPSNIRTTRITGSGRWTKLCSSRSFTRCIGSKNESGAWCKTADLRTGGEFCAVEQHDRQVKETSPETAAGWTSGPLRSCTVRCFRTRTIMDALFS